MPMRRSPANRSMRFSVSAQTRATIAPTVRQAIRINSHTAVFEHATASQATVSSNARVCPAWWRAHGTATTVGPCSGQHTRGASASKTTCTVPQSRPRHRRRPSPRSYQGALRPQRPQRRDTPLRGRTRATTSVSPSAFPPRTPRTRCLRSPCAYRHPAAPAITSHCARRCLLLWFLTFDKPETLSDNDVRPLNAATNPRKRQRSHIFER